MFPMYIQKKNRVAQTWSTKNLWQVSSQELQSFLILGLGSKIFKLPFPDQLDPEERVRISPHSMYDADVIGG